MDKRGESAEDFNLYAFRQGDALTERPSWERMQVNHLGREVVTLWAEQGHVRIVDLHALARQNPAVLNNVTALHGDDPRPLVIDTSRSGAAVESALFPVPGTRFYIKPTASDPPAWVLNTLGRAGHATSPWLIYGLLNMMGLGLMLWLTRRLQERPGWAALTRWTVAVLFVAGLIFVGNGFYEFRSATSESFAAYFGRVRFTALVMMILTLWIVAKKLGQWLNKVALVVLTLPIIWGATKIAFLALPPHEYVTYPWLLSLIAFFATASMGPEILARWRQRSQPQAEPMAAVQL